MGKRLLRVLLAGSILGGLVFCFLTRRSMISRTSEGLTRVEKVRARVIPRLRDELRAAGFVMGDPVYLRVFKEERNLEVWLRPAREVEFRLFRSYPSYFSGELGPKLAEGDRQAPEGFYQIGVRALNPRSDFHLSLNIGYPNAFDLANERTGSLIMIHGGEASIGCFAMTDPVVEEIYLLVEASLDQGQGAVPMHIFPFRMVANRLQQENESEWRGFWENLREGYDAFEATHLPPAVSVREKRYVFENLRPL